jgi:hypothetical protein
MDYQTKNNSKMLVIICPTNGEVELANLNAVLRVAELSGSMILEPCHNMENGIYNAIATAEEKRKAELFMQSIGA